MPESFFEIEHCPGDSWAEKVVNYRTSPRQQHRRDKVRGSLIGGAAGDALGYTVEFMGLHDIRQRFGKRGITAYEPNIKGYGVFSDDTQMTLFTAEGLLSGQTKASLEGKAGQPYTYVASAYDDWYATQIGLQKIRGSGEAGTHQFTWLYNVPELHARRAPGMTCMKALEASHRSYAKGGRFIDAASNNSKGCGGVMRVAPVGLLNTFGDNPGLVIEEGAAIAAITHGHPLGQWPAAVLAELVRHIVYDEYDRSYALKEAVLNTVQRVREQLRSPRYWTELERLLTMAVELAGNRETDEKNIRKLGEGWVAEEALAIAVYCAVRYADSFSDGIIAAVNHDGDSDSTGAIAGNILGAWLGISGIERKWQDNLELKEVILEIADDLCDGCAMGEMIDYDDRQWTDKYVFCTYPFTKLDSSKDFFDGLFDEK